MKKEAVQSQSYLTFHLGQEIFAVNVNNLLSILELTKITKVPHSPSYMKGIINLRGMVLPVVDMRSRFDMEEKDYDTNTCILVLELSKNDEHFRIGAIVDNVNEVIEFEQDQISPPPFIGQKSFSDFLIGMAQKGDDFVMVLDVELLFTHEEKNILKDVHVTG